MQLEKRRVFKGLRHFKPTSLWGFTKESENPMRYVVISKVLSVTGVMSALVVFSLALGVVVSELVMPSQREVLFSFDQCDKDIIGATQELVVFSTAPGEHPAWRNSFPIAVVNNQDWIYRAVIPITAEHCWLKCVFKPGAIIRRLPKFDTLTVDGQDVKSLPHSNFSGKGAFTGCQFAIPASDDVCHVNPIMVAIFLALFVFFVFEVADRCFPKYGLSMFMQENWEVLLVIAVATAMFVYKLNAPLMFGHDDNTALFSSFARSHLINGLGKTFGQDFYTFRITGEMKPYLHHPPLLALYLAAWFRVFGIDSPVLARFAMVCMSLASILIFWNIVVALIKNRLARFVSVAVFALTPMFLFMGRMANHQVPGMMFFLLGVAAALWLRNHGKLTWTTAITLIIGWIGVLLSSWHATIAALVFTVFFPLAVADTQMRLKFRLVAWVALITGAIAVTIQFLLARNGAGFGENASEVASWFSSRQGKDWLISTVENLSTAFSHGMKEYTFLPWMLFTGTISLCVWRVITHHGITNWIKVLLALAGGNIVYGILFSRALCNHAYQMYYFMPALALSAGLATDAIYVCRTIGVLRKVIIFLLFGFVFAYSSFTRVLEIYAGPSSYARMTVPNIINKFL